MRWSIAALVLSLLAPAVAQAQPPPPPPPEAPVEAAPPPPPPPPPPVEVAAPAVAVVAVAPAAVPALNWEAQVDAYYLYNFTGDPNTQGPRNRVYDTHSNSFTLNMAKLAAYVNPDPVGFRIDILYGHIGAINNSASAGSSPPPAADAVSGALYTGGFYVEQAYATLKSDMLTLDAGRFATWASDEVIETKANWNYSRSLLFNAVPFIHTGVRLGIALVKDVLTLQLAVLNGWNNDPDNNGDKTFGAQFALTLPSKTAAAITTYIGKENATDTRMLFDLVVSQPLGEHGLSLNADFFKEGDTQLVGAGLKVKLILDESFYLVPRVELVSSKTLDMAGGTTTTTTLYEGTLTAAIPIRKNYEIRAELRGDFSDKEVYLKGATPKKSQFTGLIGVLAWLP
jgi:Putative beta-barrel porin-2, OmpL-like. bbp2